MLTSKMFYDIYDRHKISRYFTLLLIITEMPNREDKTGTWMKVQFDLGNPKKKKRDTA